VSAVWYQCAVPRKRMKELMQRSDGRAIRDTALWLGALLLSGLGGYVFWGSAACVPFFLVYGLLYGTAANSRWHETGHGTAFKTRWMNDVVYQLACFMVMYEPQVWRWSHARHHTDTIIVGRDPEIVEPRPPRLNMIVAQVLLAAPRVQRLQIAVPARFGQMSSEENKPSFPQSGWPKVYRTGTQSG
jgi:fatty acid desaturase